MEKLSVHVKIAGIAYILQVDPESEAIVREAAKLIQDETERLKAIGVSDTQALAMIAFDCMTTKIRGDQQTQRLQQMVFDKITRLDQVITPAITT